MPTDPGVLARGRSIRRRRLALLAVAAIIAGAGIAYELALMLLGTVTVGSTERANAIVVGTTMFGMGIGAATGGRLARRPVTGFVTVEVVLAVLGAFAAPFLYWVWATLDALWGPLLGYSLLIGACIGAEMPLLAALNDELDRQEAATVVSNYTAADYFGALVGAVAFAFLVRPRLGIVNGTILIAVINLVAAAAVLVIMPGARRRTGGWVVAGLVAVGVAALVAPAMVDDGRQRLFRDPIIATAESGVQELVVTSRVHPGGVRDTRLFLDGDLQLSSIDEHRYHEALVHPAMAAARSGRVGQAGGASGGADDVAAGLAGRAVLILGGGDCLAAREVLRYPEATVTMVELDPTVVALMRDVPELATIQAGACDDPRLRIIHDDAFRWVGSTSEQFDVVIVDFPDPDSPALGRLYSVELYAHLQTVLHPGGAIVVQCGSPFFAPEAYWTCAETLEAAGWATVPYQAEVPSFGTWGFHLAIPSGSVSGTPRTPVAAPEMFVAIDEIDGLRYLTADVFAAAQVFPLDNRRERYDVRPSTILDPSIVAATQGAWIGY